MVSASELMAPMPACEPDAMSGQFGQCEEERLANLVQANSDRLWRLLCRLGLPDADADDAFQEVILVMARRLHTLEPAIERSFLVGTALRVARKMLSRRRRRREVSDETLEFAESQSPNPLVVTEQRRMLQILDGLLNKLPYELRSVFVLYEVEGFTLQEIADLLQLPFGTVSSRLRRARQDFEANVERVEARQRFRGES